MATNVVFVHPDLGIGGAERLVVDAALALKAKGHRVVVVTAHHDPAHCFVETRNGELDVVCVGDWLPRSLFGLCAALCAYVRMVYVALYLALFAGIPVDVVFCDLVSVCVPFLRLMRATKVVFYCHFPDQLLTERNSWAKTVYRAPLDWLEERTTGMADRILVNSKFTASVFRNTFKSLSRIEPEILYPSLNFATFDGPVDLPTTTLKGISVLFLSINRFERKKNLGLALEALVMLQQRLTEATWMGVHLIMAGGYDERVKENVGHYQELQHLCRRLNLGSHVTFLRSPSDAEKRSLLHHCTCLLYTPDREHFGIVPIEAMYMSRPVIAVNSGGPKETVLHETTGLLCDHNPTSFSIAMEKFVKDRSLAREMGAAGREHVRKTFSFDSFSDKLDDITQSLIQDLHRSKCK